MSKESPTSRITEGIKFEALRYRQVALRAIRACRPKIGWHVVEVRKTPRHRNLTLLIVHASKNEKSRVFDLIPSMHAAFVSTPPCAHEILSDGSIRHLGLSQTSSRCRESKSDLTADRLEVIWKKNRGHGIRVIIENGPKGGQ